MATINNASGVFATLGYTFTDPNNQVQTFSSDTQAHLQQMPPFLDSWQAQDIANNSVNGYFQNPVVNYVNNIITVSHNMDVAANAANLFGISAAANALNTTATSFLAHTNRVSGVTSMDGQTDLNVNPYYQTAVAFGKNVIYLTNQTDGVINSSPILGCMTSILVAPQISANSNTLSADYITLTNGISANSLSNSVITQITTDISSIGTYLSGLQSNDVTFFGNVQHLVNQYKTVGQFSGMGETEKYLVNNVVGTNKLVTRVNS